MDAVIEVAIGVVVEQRSGLPWVLIARRRQELVLGGYWEFPGGKIECGETATQCLVREFIEELGVTVRVDRPLLRIEHEYDHGRVRLRPYYCTRASGQPQNLGVAEHRWVLASQLNQFQFPPANRDLVKRLVRDCCS